MDEENQEYKEENMPNTVPEVQEATAARGRTEESEAASEIAARADPAAGVAASMGSDGGEWDRDSLHSATSNAIAAAAGGRRRREDSSDEDAGVQGGADTSSHGTRKTNGFRISAKMFSLTYPRCDVSRAAFDPVFRGKFKPTEFASAREPHKGGGHHLHVFVAFSSRRDVQSARYFDVSIDGKTYHPNIQQTRSRESWLGYISKGDDHGVEPAARRAVGRARKKSRQDQELHSFDPKQEPAGKRRGVYEDLVWTERFLEDQGMADVEWPVQLHCTDGKIYEMHRPNPATKKRNWWIVAPPNAGKTRWVNKTFARQKVYCPRMGKYPFEGYRDQDIIIYDDRKEVTFEEFSDVANTWDIRKPVFGEVRFRTQDWKLSHSRNIIVLSNKTIEEAMKEEDHQRMKKRFIQIVNPTLLDPDEISDAEEQDAVEFLEALPDANSTTFAQFAS